MYQTEYQCVHVSIVSVAPCAPIIPVCCCMLLLPSLKLDQDTWIPGLKVKRQLYKSGLTFVLSLCGLAVVCQICYSRTRFQGIQITVFEFHIGCK